MAVVKSLRQDHSELMESNTIASPTWLSDAAARRIATGAALLTDIVAVGISMALLMIAVQVANSVTIESGASVLVGFLPLLVIAFLVAGLYSPLFMHPAQEMRRVFQSILLVALLSAVALMVAGASQFILVHLLLISLALLFVMPLNRVMARILLARTDWWGVPVLVFSDGETGDRVIRLLRRWPELGLRPRVLVQEGARTERPSDMHVLDQHVEAPEAAIEHDIRCAIVAMPSMNHHELGAFLDQQGKFFKHMFVVPSIGMAHCLWSTATSYDGLVGFAIQHYHWRRNVRRLKRAVDFVGAAVIAIVIMPATLLVALLIKLDSAGPVFFCQERMGERGQCFNVVKFRTMYVDAEERLTELLEQDASLREEYLLYHKLSDDPRVTEVGKWLRRYSIDELPQLLNVLLGQMSLVGPRAYMPAELGKMNGLARAVLQSPPGMTGLWQVSGRNRLSFEERVDLDVHYLQNWSPWLDLYILARTVPVVTTGDGAR